MGKRKLTYSAGIIATLSSIAGIVVYGGVLILVGGYALLIVGLISAIGGGTSSAGMEIGVVIAILCSFFLIPTILSVLGVVFGTRLSKMASYNDYEYRHQKARIITYMVFLFIFAVASTIVGYFVLINGAEIKEEVDSVVSNIVLKLPLLFVMGPAYLASFILLLIEMIRKRKFFKSDIPAPEPVVPPQLQQPFYAQPQYVQPQVITIKDGEEIPEALKGRLVPVPPPVGAVPEKKEEPSVPDKSNTAKKKTAKKDEK